MRPFDLGDEPPPQTPSEEDELRSDATPGQRNDAVDDWGLQSFPASDPPQNW